MVVVEETLDATVEELAEVVEVVLVVVWMDESAKKPATAIITITITTVITITTRLIALLIPMDVTAGLHSI